MKRLIFACTAAVLMSAALYAAPVQAQPNPEGFPPLSGWWHPFSWDTAVSPNQQQPAFTFGGAATIRITDVEENGDQFEVLDNGVVIGTTSTPMSGTAFEPNPNNAYALGGFSSGEFSVGPGQHSITMRTIQTSPCCTAGVGYIAIYPPTIPADGTPTCIEADAVQNSPEAAGLEASHNFRNGPTMYMIIAGPPTCRPFCPEGTTINCLPANTCPAGLNVLKVDDIKKCLAALAPPAAEEAPPAAAAPISAPAAPGLASTGAESAVLGYLGTAMIAFGAVAMAGRSRLKSR